MFGYEAKAGLLGGPIAYPAPALASPLVHEAPVAHVAPVAIKTAVPVATSYQNTYQISSAAVPVVAAAPVAFGAPVVKTPIVSAPAFSYIAAPTVLKSSLLASPYGHY